MFCFVFAFVTCFCNTVFKIKTVKHQQCQQVLPVLPSVYKGLVYTRARRLSFWNLILERKRSRSRFLFPTISLHKHTHILLTDILASNTSVASTQPLYLCMCMNHVCFICMYMYVLYIYIHTKRHSNSYTFQIQGSKTQMLNMISTLPMGHLSRCLAKVKTDKFLLHFKSSETFELHYRQINQIR